MTPAGLMLAAAGVGGGAGMQRGALGPVPAPALTHRRLPGCACLCRPEGSAACCWSMRCAVCPGPLLAPRQRHSAALPPGPAPDPPPLPPSPTRSGGAPRGQRRPGHRVRGHPRAHRRPRGAQAGHLHGGGRGLQVGAGWALRVGARAAGGCGSAAGWAELPDGGVSCPCFSRTHHTATSPGPASAPSGKRCQATCRGACRCAALVACPPSPRPRLRCNALQRPATGRTANDPKPGAPPTLTLNPRRNAYTQLAGRGLPWLPDTFECGLVPVAGGCAPW